MPSHGHDIQELRLASATADGLFSRRVRRVSRRTCSASSARKVQPLSELPIKITQVYGGSGGKPHSLMLRLLRQGEPIAAVVLKRKQAVELQETLAAYIATLAETEI